MSRELKVIMNNDGVFEEYDDTYDITIHLESEEEQDKIIEWLNKMLESEGKAYTSTSTLEQEPCDAVSRKAAIDACIKGLNRKKMVSNIKALPSFAPARKKGRWVYLKDNAIYQWECSECKHWWETKNNYCPKCGAMMQEAEE